MKFSDWLQLEMNKRGWTQSDLARASNLHRAVINKLLNGRSRQSKPDTLHAIARALKTPPETVYRAAGLLPPISESEAFLAELAHKFSSIRNPARKATALNLLQALVDEEMDEQGSTYSDTEK